MTKKQFPLRLTQEDFDAAKERAEKRKWSLAQWFREVIKLALKRSTP